MTRLIDLTETKRQVAEWSKHNFPGKTPIQPALGVVEEAGELAHAILKRSQRIRGDAAQHDAAEQDALADCGVFLLDFASQIGMEKIEFQYEHGSTMQQERRLATLISACSQLYRDVAFGSIKIHLQHDVIDVAQALMHYCDGAGWEFLEILDRVWSEVRQRDWVLYPQSGLPPKEEAA